MKTVAVFHVPCKKCHGEGKYPEIMGRCPYCRAHSLNISRDPHKFVCGSCHRAIHLLFVICSHCKGTGYLPESRHR